MIPKQTAVFAAAALAAVLAAPGGARADIITSLHANPVAVSGGYAYTYDAQLSGGQLDPVSGYNDRDGNAVQAQFGTVYDFGPILQNADGSMRITVTGLISSFYWTFNNTDVPADATSPADSPNRANIRFIFQGTRGIAVAGDNTTFDNAGTTTPYDTVTAGDPANLGTFTVVSAFGPTLDTRIRYDGQTYKGTNNTLQANIGFTSGPALPAEVPEPATFALLGAGLLGLAFRRFAM